MVESPEQILARCLSAQRTREALDVDAMCAQHPEHAEALRRLVAARNASQAPDATVQVDAGAGDDEDACSDVIERLHAHASASSRYELRGEIARGGMGAILQVWDQDLRRALAMKVILDSSKGAAGKASSVRGRLLNRFVEEAQITGQLDHPGIVPVHELAIDRDGRVFFTMKLVKGHDLGAVLQWVKDGTDGWTQARAVSVILKVCEAMAYAHAKHVIHRDLKPANIMVGRFGEVYVMDWGLARLLDQKDSKDIRVRPEPRGQSIVDTDVRGALRPDSPLLTMDGDVVGTPAYMSPEQARGDLDAMGPASDVYSIGAILYELIAGHAPYQPPGVALNCYAVWGLVQVGPPAPLRARAKLTPPELIAICERAMAREIVDRYPDTLAMAEDLRAYVEGRVVRAHRTGAFTELRKWTQRNRGLAATIAAAVVAVVVLVALFSVERGKVLTISASQVQTQSALDLAQAEGYVAGILAADASLQANEMSQARRHLATCAEALRGWEWDYLDLTCDTSVQALHQAARLTSVALDATGDNLAAGTADGRVLLWRAKDGRYEPAGEVSGGEGRVVAVALLEDRARIVAVGGQATATIDVRDRATLQPMGRFQVGASIVRAVAIHPDGRHVAVGGFGSAIHIVDLESGRARVLEGELSSIQSLAYEPDGSRLLAASEEQVEIWREDLRAEAFAAPGLRATAFAALGDVLVAADARVWLRRAGSPDVDLEQRAASYWTAAAARGRLLAAADDGVVRVWNSVGGKLEESLRGHAATVRAMAFAPAAARLVTCSDDGSVRIWRLGGNSTAEVERGACTAVALSRDGAWLAVGMAQTNQLVVAAAVSRRRVFATPRLPGRVSKVAFSPSGARVAVVVEGADEVLVWHPASRALQARLAHAGAPITALDFGAADDEITTVSGATVRTWTIASTPDQSRFREQHLEAGTTATCLARATGGIVAVGTVAGSVQVLGGAGESLRQWPAHHEALRAIAFDAEGQQVATASDDRTIRIWNARTGDLVRQLVGHSRGVTSIAFDAGDTRLVSGSTDQTIRVWNAATGRALLTLRGHDNAVVDVATHLDGAAGIVSVGADDTLRSWRARRLDAPRESLEVTEPMLAVPIEGAGAPSLEVAIIVHPGNPTTDLSLAELRSYLKLERMFWPDRQRTVLCLPPASSDVMGVLLAKVYETTAPGLRKFWIGKAFRGEIPAAPSVVPTSEAAGTRVNGEAGAFSVVRADQVPEGVRVVTIDGKRPGEAGYPLRSDG